MGYMNYKYLLSVFGLLFHSIWLYFELSIFSCMISPFCVLFRKYYPTPKFMKTSSFFTFLMIIILSSLLRSTIYWNLILVLGGSTLIFFFKRICSWQHHLFKIWSFFHCFVYQFFKNQVLQYALVYFSPVYSASLVCLSSVLTTSAL